MLVTLCTAPVMVAILSALLLRERLTAMIVLALLPALVGTVDADLGRAGNRQRSA